MIDLVTGESLDTLPGYVQFVSEDESFLMVQEGNNTSIRDAKTFKPYCTVPGNSIRLSADRSRFTVGPDSLGGVVVYDLKTGKRVCDDSFPDGIAVTLNENGTKLLVRNRQSGIELWDVDSGKKNGRYPSAGVPIILTPLSFPKMEKSLRAIAISFCRFNKKMPRESTFGTPKPAKKY